MLYVYNFQSNYFKHEKPPAEPVANSKIDNESILYLP